MKIYAADEAGSAFARRGMMPVLIFGLFCLLLLSLSRLLLMAGFSEHLVQGYFLYTLLQGLRVDFATVCAILASALLILIVCNALKRLPKILLILIKAYLSLMLMLLVINEAATPSFIMEYGLRPNHLYVRYLIYPKEVFSMLLSGHLASSLLTIAAAGCALGLGYRFLSFLFKDYAFSSLKGTALALVLTLAIVPLGIRSTLGHRPLNPAMIAFSQDALANTLPLNSTYSAVYALTHMDPGLSPSEIYDFVDEKTALAVLDEISVRTKPAAVNDRCPLNQVIEGRAQKLNVVVILEESLGAKFSESLGGLPLTPELEKLKAQGWWFQNLFAAGHRSIRGIEAVTASMPPSPLESVVKLPPHTPSLVTLSEIFSELSYHTSFIYGGESHFDNMRAYFLGTGTQEIIEQKDYENPSFTASWGVSDEDLFNRAHERFASLYEQGQPFFAVVFTSSFHDPFDIPPGKVELPAGIETNDPARLKAAMYADFALGRFFDKARQADYYQNTLFLVAADHESKVRGYDNSFPIKGFRIPGLFLGAGITPHIDNRLVSQIDLPVTLLSLAGVHGEIPFAGQDLTREIKERALMQFNDSFAFYKDGFLTVLDPAKRASFFKVGKDLKLSEISQAVNLDEAAAAVNLGPVIYKNNLQNKECLKLK